MLKYSGKIALALLAAAPILSTTTLVAQTNKASGTKTATALPVDWQGIAMTIGSRTGFVDPVGNAYYPPSAIFKISPQ